MEHKKTKIVLDADVIIHFMEANYFSILPDIFPEYEYLILDVVYNYCRKKMTEQECKEFMQEVNNAGSKLPIVDITQYTCTVQI